MSCPPPPPSSTAGSLARAPAVASSTLPGGHALEAQHHLYSIDLPPNGIQGAGRPTRLDLPPGSALSARGALAADQPVTARRFEGFAEPFPVYPDGPVTLRLPVELPQGAGPAVATVVSVTYMACSSEGRCMPPVAGQLVAVTVPTA